MITPLRNRLANLWFLYGLRLRRAPLPPGWPDFTKVDVILINGRMRGINPDGSEEFAEETMAYLPDLPPDHAIYNGWFRDLFEYRTFAALIFAYRYPNHPFSEETRQRNPGVADHHILDLQTGRVGIEWRAD